MASICVIVKPFFIVSTLQNDHHTFDNKQITNVIVVKLCISGKENVTTFWNNTNNIQQWLIYVKVTTQPSAIEKLRK